MMESNILSGKNLGSASTLLTSPSAVMDSQKRLSSTAKLSETTEEQYVDRYLNHFNQFTDFTMIAEYTEFCARQRSLMLMFSLNIFFTGSLICAIVSTAQLSTNHSKYSYVVGFLSAAWGIDLVEVCLVWMLFYSQLVPQQTSTVLQWIRKNSHHIQYAVLMCLTLSYVCRLLGRVISGECDDTQTLLFTSWNCNQYAATDGLPMDTAFALMLTPILFSNIAREVRVEYVMSSFAAACIALVLCTYLVNSWRPFSYVGPYIILGALINFNSTRQNAINFLMYRKLKHTLEENELMAAEVRANELRHMIRNVAHDLKTPLTSFMLGIDLMSQFIEDYEHVGYSTAASEIQSRAALLASIKSGMEDIRSTNAFMLMAVNRCMDYTKASVGLQLTPKYETTNFRESLHPALDCLKYLQDKIKVVVSPIPPNVASRIITDRQWLQENLLCYLSNAVKYAKSEVTISISVQSAVQPLEGSAKDATRELSHDTSSSRESRLYPPSIAKSSSRDEESDYSSHSMSVSGYLDHGASEADIGKWFRMKERERLRFESVQHVVLVEVEDDGVGLSDVAMAALFDPQKQFQRLTAGLGLGLYSLAKRIEALKGSYGVKRRKGGKSGSVFWFSFPYKVDDTSHSSTFYASLTKKPSNQRHKPREKARIRIAPAANNTILFPPLNDEILVNSSTRSSDESDSSPPVSKSIPVNQPRILLVEGSPTIAKPTCIMLSRQGHPVNVATNGEEALQLIEQAWRKDDTGCKAAYDIVLMDMQTSMADGESACIRLRRLEAERKERFCGNISTVDSAEDNERVFVAHAVIGTVLHHLDDDNAAHAGFDAVLSKPFSYDKLVSAYVKLQRPKKPPA